jgi:hypothetical protein
MQYLTGEMNGAHNTWQKVLKIVGKCGIHHWISSTAVKTTSKLSALT